MVQLHDRRRCGLPSRACRPFRKIDPWLDRFLESSVVAERYRECQFMQGSERGCWGDQTFLGQSSLPCGKDTAIRVRVAREEAGRVSGSCFQHELELFGGEEH